jgi:PAS domain S-box-containing protein
VTEQVTARQAQDSLIGELEAARERLSRALSTGRVGVFEWEINKDVLSISGPIAQFFGVEAQEAEAGLPLHTFMRGIHPEDQERVAAAVQRTAETGEAYDAEYRLQGIEGTTRSVIARGHVEETAAGQRRFIGVLIDVTEQKAAEQAIVDAGQRLRLALEASRMGDWSWDPVQDTVELSERAAEIFGTSSLRTTWTRLQQRIHPDDRDTVLRTVERAAREGASYAIEYRMQNGSSGAERWVSSRGRGSYAGQGRLTGMFGIVEDITARKKAEETQTILLHEVDHRAKNILAVVRSLVRMTPFRDKEDYVEVLSGRIHALARAHSLLSNNRWLGASLADLVRQELVPYAAEGERFSLDGPPVEIRARGTQALSLVLHELATNAAKHGALSRPGGHIHVRWSADSATAVEMEWREAGGADVRKPSVLGFGSRLIDGAARQMQAEIQQEWRSDGLRFVLRLPGSVAVRSAMPEAPPRQDDRQGGGLERAFRVLIVEDEALIAMEMEDALVSAGAEVAGKAYSLQDALSRVEADNPDIAVIDMDLNGESALPLIELLRKRATPFVVATGFEQPGLEHDWILRKPISQDVLVRAVNEAARQPIGAG